MNLNQSKSLLKDIIDVMSSNVFSIISSIITGLIVPKVLGATNYGYYRMFVLYMSYTALLHFGFVDGLLLIDGDKNLDELNKYKYRSNSLVFIIIQFIIFVIFICFSLFIRNTIYSTLFFTVGLGTFLYNITTYYMFITQIIMYFKRLSILNSLQSLLNIIITLMVCGLYKWIPYVNINYSFYIWCMLIVYFVMFLIYIYIYRNLTFGNHDYFRHGLNRIIYYCKHGIFLTISYQISNLIMIIDNQFVSIFFVASVYGKYSLSYSISNAVGVVISAISPVLLPHLKRDKFSHIIKIYNKMIALMLLAIYFCLISYFPLVILIKLILPGYIQSLSYLKVFLPELSITCPVVMIMFNYYNVLNKSKFYFCISIIVLLISVIIDSISYLLFHDSLMLAYGSLITTILWYFISEYFLVKWYLVKWHKNLIYMSIMMIGFFVCSFLNDLTWGFIIYVIIYVGISMLMYCNLLKKFYYICLNKII